MRYHEVQHFSRALLGTLLIFVLVVVTVALVSSGSPLLSWPSAGTLAGATVPMFLVLLLRLETTVDDTALTVRLWFLPRRVIPLSSIRSAEVRTYRPLLEYGGWGIRWGRGGMAYNARGNRGVQLVLENGSRVLIGSQEPERLLEAIRPRTAHAA
jgi:hypothetical protein